MKLFSVLQGQLAALGYEAGGGSVSVCGWSQILLPDWES